MGTANKGRYSEHFATAASTYSSHSYYDDLAWAACWLYRATNDSAYLTVRALLLCNLTALIASHSCKIQVTSNMHLFW